MTYNATTITEYISQIPLDRQEAFSKLRQTIHNNLPSGFEEGMAYGMIGYSIPHSIYPPGYHANPVEPVPFIGLASQKNYIALYHMGIMVFPEVLEWFKKEYGKVVPTKLDMGKSCIRFKKVEMIPFELVGELCRKIELEEYLEEYKRVLEKHKSK